MTTHAALPGTVAADPISAMGDDLDAATSSATRGRTWLDPIPAEQVEFLAQNFERGHWVIAPLLDPSRIRIRSIEAELYVTPSQLQQLRDGDAALAGTLVDSLTPVHSIGSVTIGGTQEGFHHAQPGMRTLRYVVYRSEYNPRQMADCATYDDAVTTATLLADHHPGVAFHIRGELRADGRNELVSIRSDVTHVTAQLAVADYDDDAPIVGYEVVEGAVDLHA